jgi:hypothetical protein
MTSNCYRFRWKEDKGTGFLVAAPVRYFLGAVLVSRGWTI